MTALLLPAGAQTPPPANCGATTLEHTLVVGDDGRLQCGPGENTVIPDDNLAPPSAVPVAQRDPLISFATIADLQWSDEESPLRGEWADKCPPSSPISSSAFRPQETMVGQLANSHVEAINQIAAEGGPKLHQPMDLVLTLGDLSDNQQFNEIRYFVDTFDGAKLVDPDSGDDPVLDGDGYDGVQGADPKGSGVPLPAPTAGGPPVNDSVNPLEEETLLDLANEPFWAPGFHGPNGEQIPWYALPGNHDVKVQGTIFDDNAAWRALVRRYATGHVKVMELAPDYQSRLCDAFQNQDADEFQAVMTDIMTNPHRAGTTKVVPSDPSRLPLYRSQEAMAPGDKEACTALTLQNPLCDTTWVQEQFATSGIPAGHGYTEENRCKDEEGNLIPRLCYSFVQGDFLFIGLDTSPPEGLERGSIDQEQFAWLERTIKEHSSRYFDAQGHEVSNPGVEDKLVVIYSHHPTRSLTNTGLWSSAEERGAPAGPLPENGAKLGEDLEEMLLHYPNVILHSSGHTHENNVWVHKDDNLQTGYYEVNTASVADMPSESRMFEISDNTDGTLSIFSTIIEGLAPPDPRAMDWAEDDATKEIEHGAARNSNEDWLASFGREVGYHDPQGNVEGARGEADVRNVELLLPAPFDLNPQVATTLTYRGSTSGRVGKIGFAVAQLTDAGGTPLSNMQVTFSLGKWTRTVTTSDRGIAFSAFRVTGPKGTFPMTVSFAGVDPYQPSQVQTPFTVR
jgi:metallophosphoesterase (TIGR03767 family)